jgi:gliding motility-associated-like protein
MRHILQAAIAILLLPFISFAQVPTSADCLGALPVCQEVIVEPNPGTNDGNYNNEINTTNSCVSGEDNSIWYTFTANANGFLNFVITPDDPDDDYDWALFDITGAECGDIFSNPDLEVSCNAAGGAGCHGPTGATGATTYSVQGAGCGTDPPSAAVGFSTFNDQVPMQAGNTYVLMVSNWTGSPNGYTIDFSNSTDIGILDAVNPELLTALFPMECDDETINIEFSENIQCSTINDFNFQLTGTGGPYTVSLSSSVCDAGGEYDRFFELTVSPALPAVGNYTLNLITNGSTQVLDLCDNPAFSWSGNFSTNNELQNEPSLIPDEITVCAGETVSITPFGNNGLPSPNFNFYSNSGLTDLLFSGNNYTFTAETTMQIWVTEFSGICESPPAVFSLTANFVPPPPNAIDPPSFCQGSPVLDLIAFGSGGTINWYTSDPTVGNPTPVATGSPVSPNLDTSVPGAIILWVTESTQEGCVSDPDIISVIITELPEAPQTNIFNSICVNGDIPQLEASGNGGTINWYDVDPALGGNPAPVGMGNTFTPDIDVSSPATISFWMTETDANGCVGPANQTIIGINPLPELLDSELLCAADLQTYTATLNFQYTDDIFPNQGDVQNNGGGSFTISGIDIDTDLEVTAVDQTSGCINTFNFLAPNCGCPDINPPLSGGDVQICEGETIPSLSASVGTGETVDWYDAAVDGTLLLADNDTYMPTVSGTYYAETHLIGGDCTSETRTPVTLGINPLPVLEDTTASCSADLLTYTVFLSLSNTDSLTISGGILLNNGGGDYEISGIDIAATFTATAIDTATLCSQDIIILPPSCDCSDVDAPVNNGDIQVCEGGAISDFNAIVGPGETIDWYDAPTGGILLLQGSTSFTPVVADTFYAETRVIINNCISSIRTPFILIINPLPALISAQPDCAADLLTYSLVLDFLNTDSLLVNTGTVTDNGGGNYSITDIDIDSVFTVTAINSITLCSDNFVIDPPDCACLDVNAPVSAGDLEICEGDVIPTLTVSVGPGETVDWYDALVGGNLILDASLSFTPTVAGTYYAETRVVNSGCTSTTRTSVTLTVNPLPVLINSTSDCSADLLTFSTTLSFSNTDSLVINEGTLFNNGSGGFTITEIDINTALTGTAINTTTGCQQGFSIAPPVCPCPDLIPPVNNGDEEICNGDIIPELSVSVGIDETVDWYNADTGGVLLMQNSLTFTPAAAGTYYAETMSLINGCVSSLRTPVILTIHENPILTVADSADPGCGLNNGMVGLNASPGQAPFQYQIDNGSFQDESDFGGLSANVNYSFTVEDANGCVGTIEASLIEAVGPNAVINGVELLTCNNQLFQMDAIFSTGDGVLNYEWRYNGAVISNTIQTDVTDPGIYILNVIQDACVDSDTVIVEQNLSPELMSVLQSEIQLDCTIQSVQLDGTGSSSGDTIIYAWFFEGNPIVGASDNTYDASEAGIYTLEVTNSSTGCSASDDFDLINNESYPVANAGNDLELNCIIESLELNGSNSQGGASIVYQWFDQTLNPINGATSNTLTVSAPGTYTLEVRDTDNGCANEDTVEVTSDFVPPIAEAGIDRQLDCNEEMLVLSGTGSTVGSQITYLWDTSGGGNILSGITSLAPAIEAPGLYYLTVINNDNGCIATDSTTVTRVEEIQTAISVTSADESCFGEADGSFLLTAEDPDVQVLYSINNEPFMSQTQFTNLNAGTYEILAEDSNGCRWDSTVIISQGADVVVDLGEDIFIHLGDSVQLEALVNIPQNEIDAITWTNPEELHCDNCLDPYAAQLLETTIFGVTVSDLNGCFDSDELTVYVDRSRQVYIPNAFSPNGDGNNDVFVVYTGSDVVQIKSFIVFDRWGENIYEAYGFSGNTDAYGWDGKYRNKLLNTGVYVYMTEIEFLDGEVIIYTGDVLLSR